MKEKTSKEKARELREQMKQTLEANTKTTDEGADKAVAWVNGCAEHLRQSLLEYLEKVKLDEGVIEATLIALARVTCVVVEGVNRHGLSKDGLNAYDVYYEAILPTAHEIVLEEIGQ